MKAAISIDQALLDSKLLGAALGDASTWSAWLAVLRAAFGIKLNRTDLRAFHKVAGSRKPPRRKVAELWAIVGRRSGKSRMAAAIAVYIACFCEHKLAAGELGYVLALAATADQAKTVFDYCLGFIQASPILSSQLEGEPTRDEIRLKGGIVIAVHVSSFRHVRGKTLLAVVADEMAFWRDDTSTNPDREVLRAVTPSLAASGGMLVAISSPYRKVGVLHERHRDYFGVDDPDVLVISAPTTELNPTINSKIIERAHRDDAEAARSEWGAEFRTDLTSLLDDKTIDSAIFHSRPLELRRRDGVRYFAFTDASAGRHDAFTLCIGHVERDGCFVADVIRGRDAPFDPASVAGEYAALARAYGCEKVVGDAFAGEWVAAAFKAAGIQYETSDLNKSALYLEALPLFNQGKVSIPQHDRLVRELRLLERRVARSGRDSVDHPRNGTDDFANAVCGALHIATARKGGPIRIGYIQGDGGGSIHWKEAAERPRLRFVRVDEKDAPAVRGILRMGR